MAEKFAVYRYEIRRDGEPSETRWSFTPVKSAGYAGNDEPSDAHPMAEDGGESGGMQPAGHVEAPEGSRITSLEPPIIEIPGRGSIDLLAVIGVGEGEAGPLADAVRYRPQGARRA